MKRRDSERNHTYANIVFDGLNIFEIQGILKEDASIIINNSQQKGLTYLNNVRPYNKMYNNNAGLQK